MATQAHSAAVPAHQEKKCSKCGEVKPLDDFGTRRERPSGRRSKCRMCERAAAAEWRERHPEKVAAQVERDRAAGRGKDRQATYRKRHPDRVAAAAAQRRVEKPEEIRAQERARYAINRAHVAARKKRGREKDLDKVRAQERARRLAVDPAVRRERYRKQNLRRRETPAQRLANSIRVRVHKEVFGSTTKAGRRTFDLLGYTPDQLRAHLERQFLPGMTWDNYGRDWHIDHRLPLSMFSYETPDDPDFCVAWAITNLQPLWAEANHSKGANRTLLV